MSIRGLHHSLSFVSELIADLRAWLTAQSKCLVVALLWALLSLDGVSAQALPFSLGETLYFDLYVGFLHVGEGQLQLKKNPVRYKEKNYAHLCAYGKTKGFWRMIYKVDDTWGSYYDLKEGYPVYFYRFLKENSYRKYETTTFDQKSHTAHVEIYEDQALKTRKEAHRYALKKRSYDIISIYYKIRTLRLDTFEEGQLLKLPVFFEDICYEISIRYLGTHLLKTDLGTYKAHLLMPIMPKNKAFSGEDAVKVWISTDRNRLPLRIYADMKLGSVRMDLKSFHGLKYALEE